MSSNFRNQQWSWHQSGTEETTKTRDIMGTEHNHYLFTQKIPFTYCIKHAAAHHATNGIIIHVRSYIIPHYCSSRQPPDLIHVSARIFYFYNSLIILSYTASLHTLRVQNGLLVIAGTFVTAVRCLRISELYSWLCSR